MNQDIFRKKALQQLSSPEQLDRLMTVTTPVGWLALAALGLILAAAMVWGIFGRIPITAQGAGFFVNAGGVYEVVAESSGRVYDFRIRPGDTVEAGQVVARISQPDLLNELFNAKKEMDILWEQYRLVEGNLKASNEFNAKTLILQEAALVSRLEGLRNQLGWLDQQVAANETLLSEGVITKQNLMAAREQRDAAKAEIKAIMSQIEELGLKRQSFENVSTEKLLQSSKQIRERESANQALAEKVERTGRVVSPLSGKVLAVMADIGTVVQAGSPILSLSLVGPETAQLMSVTYVSAAEAKLIRPGMRVQLSPAEAKKEEYGYLEGRVFAISTFPSTPEEIMDMLHNETIVKELNASGAPYKVEIDLMPSKTSVSGYKWSSSRGEKIPVKEGTRCSATFVVKEVMPVSLVIPLFNKYVLGH